MASTSPSTASPPHAGQEEDALIAFPAAVRLVLPIEEGLVGEEATRAIESRERELLDLARKMATDPRVFDENGRKPFFWEAEISSNRRDYYYTRMMPSTLRNFAEQAKAGVSFQNSHDIRHLGLGRSLDGRYKGAQGSGVATTTASFYTVPGLHLNEVSTDDFIAGVRTGILSDVSVGAAGGRTICSICNRDMMDIWDWLFGDSEEESCTHFAGVEYTIDGEKRIAEGHIEDAMLLEVSAVYKGATPNASIIKAQRAADAGKVPPELARILEAKYRILLPGVRHVWTGMPDRSVAMADTAPTGTTPTPATETTPTPGATESAPPAGVGRTHIVRILRDAGIPEAEYSSDDAAIDRLNRYVADLSKEAADGRLYRSRVIEDAIGQGKRAMGDAFSEERYRGILNKLSTEDVQTFHDDWQRQASAAFPGGPRTNARAQQDNTRHRPEGDTTEREETSRNGEAPASAYRAR